MTPMYEFRDSLAVVFKRHFEVDANDLSVDDFHTIHEQTFFRRDER
jgi:hypothetical protein